MNTNRTNLRLQYANEIQVNLLYNLRISLLQVLVSENDLPINRDDEDGDVDKEALEATLDAALDADGKGGLLSDNKPLNAAEEKSTANWKESQWQRRDSGDGHHPDSALEQRKDTSVNDPMEQECMVLHASKKNVTQINQETETPSKMPGGPGGEEKRATTEKTSENYTHQPLTEDLLLHHTHLEKLKVRTSIG